MRSSEFIQGVPVIRVEKILRPSKEISLDHFDDTEWRELLGDIVLVTGTYDLLTPNHPQFIRTARNLEKGLTCVLTVDTDEFVTERKGSLRPIVNYDGRTHTLAEYDFVDWIVPHCGSDREMILRIKPRIFVMSYSTAQSVPESRHDVFAAMREVGGTVALLPVTSEYRTSEGAQLSTSGIIDVVRKRYSS